MELFLLDHESETKFHQQDLQMLLSDGSLLEGFINRFNKKQPFAAPLDIKRYFITPRESEAMFDVCNIWHGQRYFLS